MSATTVFRDSFNSTVGQFVEDVSTHPDIGEFTIILLVFLAVLVYFEQVVKFILTGLDAESIINATLMIFVTLGVWGSYQFIIDEAVAVADGLGLLFLEIGTGNTDPFFLFKWITHSLNYMHGEEVSIFDMTVGDLLYAAIWYVVALVLQVCMYFIGSWAVWTLALAKALSILFIPFLMHPGTRTLFDAWFRFTLGALMLLIVLRLSGVIVGLGVKAQFTAMGAIQCGHVKSFSDCTWSVRNTHGAGYQDVGDAIITVICGILLIVSSVALSTVLVGNVASPGKAASRGVGMATSKIMASKGVAELINKFKGA
ncbi:hypothetical protein [Vibrio coralliilyticus]|uniref:hypothetical protein n=1 Tax=Vibrio coralliilyticus TaxID=190893 RepID=UPI000C16521D|nr:hypothetical protein [Vibrio coralliilyticus]